MPVEAPRRAFNAETRMAAGIVGAALGDGLFHQMTMMSKLEDGWDGEGSLAIRREPIVAAGGLMVVCPHAWGPAWRLHPMLDGNVRVDLRLSEDVDAEITVLFDAPGSAYYCVYTTADGRALYFGEPVDAAAYLRKTFPTAPPVEA